MWYLEASGEWGGKKFSCLDSMHGFCHLLKLAAPGFLREGPLRLALSITFHVSLGRSGFPRIKLLLERKKKLPLAPTKCISSQGCLQGKIRISFPVSQNPQVCGKTTAMIRQHI